jgi:hypothetical protein
VRDKVAIARLEEQVLSLRDRVVHIEMDEPQAWKGR